MALLVSQTYAGVFLNAADLAPLGRRRNAVVHDVAAEEIGQEKRQRLVLDLVSPAGKAWSKRVRAEQDQLDAVGGRVRRRRRPAGPAGRSKFGLRT